MQCMLPVYETNFNKCLGTFKLCINYHREFLIVFNEKCHFFVISIEVYSFIF